MQHIETLESRQLLSATIQHAAKTKPTIPNIAFTFTGTGHETKPINAIGDLVLDVTLESSKGVISGTSTNTTANKTADFTGKVTVKDAITFKVLGTDNKTVFTFKGKYSPTAHTITGTYTGVATKTVKASKGTFSLAEGTD
ncbi:MAG TPA: hypothetical protein VGG19_17320 [Tepidisphaeraceae bacterium]|jgi:hypothetical protein